MYSEWSKPYPHLEPGQPRENALILRFREGAVRNERASEDGPAVYDRVFQVQVMAIGQKNSAPIYTLMRIVGGEEKINEPIQHRKFKAVFEQWRANIEPAHEGTPLEHWPLMTMELVRAFKDANIYTVEQLSAAPDHAAQNVRAPFFDWRAKAQGWLSEAKAKGGDAKARADNAKLQKEVEDLRKQVAQLLAVQNGGQEGPKGFDKPKRRKKANGADDDIPVSIPDEAMEEFEDDRL